MIGVDALDEVLRVIENLNRARVDYVVVGGVALNLHGLVRATEDLDIFIRPDEENIERLRTALGAVWEDPDIDQITAEDLCGDYPAVRYGPPDGSIYLDIMTRLGETTRYADLIVDEKDAHGVRVRVASPRSLYQMKKDTVRPIDRSDALALSAAFDLGREEG
ncbi:MAG: nucleotidyl transferase AbiEii/AbiGii toxin family protein [Myxococcota bacterium]